MSDPLPNFRLTVEFNMTNPKTLRRFAVQDDAGKIVGFISKENVFAALSLAGHRVANEDDYRRALWSGRADMR